MTMYIAAGTQSAHGKQNHLIIMKMSDIQEMDDEDRKSMRFAFWILDVETSVETRIQTLYPKLQDVTLSCKTLRYVVRRYTTL